MKRSRLLGLPAFAAMATASATAVAADVQVAGAWVRLAAVPGNPAAGYFILKGGAADDRLIAIQSPAADRIELHEGGMARGMTMRAVKQVALPANGEVRFAPGGYHAMIFGVKPAVRAGGAIPLRFVFASGKRVEARARTISAGDSPP